MHVKTEPLRLMMLTLAAAMILCFAQRDLSAADAFQPTPRNVSLVQNIQAVGNAWQVAAGDVTGDKKSELIYACYDGTVACQDETTGQVLWTFPTQGFPYDLSTADLDGDGKAETLVASADGHVYVITPEGKLRWQFASEGPMYQVKMARLAGAPCVVASGADKNLYVFDAGGKELKRVGGDFPVRLIAPGDLDGDGHDELVVSYALQGDLRALKGVELKKLWDRTVMVVTADATASRQNPSARFRPYSMCLKDLDGDGHAEILLGSGFYNNNGIRVLKSDGELLWDKPDGFIFRDGGYYSHTEVMAADVDPAPGLEIVVLNTRRLSVYDRQGNRLSHGEAPVTFCGIALLDAKPQQTEVLLASAPNGDDQVYVVRLAGPWTKAFGELTWRGKMAQVKANLERVQRQIKDYAGTAPPDRHYMQTVSSGAPFDAERVKGHFRRLDAFKKAFPYSNQTGFMVMTVKQTEAVPPLRAALKEGTTSAQIVALVKLYEESNVPFLVSLSHGCLPEASLETAEKILQACPKTCLGFMTSEESTYTDRLDKFLTGYWLPLLDICKRQNKKAIMVEKAAWWATIPAMERYRKLFDGTYADVLVMSVEDSSSRSPELNLSGREGLLLSGAINTLSARTIADELCWHRLWEWEYPQTGHPFLRRQMVQALLGATWFEYQTHLYDNAQIDPRGADLSMIGQEHFAIIADLLGKGLLIPPKPAEMLNLAPVALRLREPAPAYLAEAFNWDDRAYSTTLRQGKSPFEGLACYWGMAPAEPYYLGSYLMGVQRHYGNFLPRTPHGFPVLVPAFIDTKRCRWAASAWETDGMKFFKDGKALDGLQARPEVLKSFAEAASALPFRLEGDAFMQAQQIDPNTVRLTLVDPGFLDPADRAVRIVIQTKRPVKQMVDLLNGQALPVKDGGVELTVPAGVFRIVEAKF